MNLPQGQELKAIAEEHYDSLMPDISGIDKATYVLGFGGGWNSGTEKALAVIDEKEAENERLRKHIESLLSEIPS